MRTVLALACAKHALVQCPAFPWHLQVLSVRWSDWVRLSTPQRRQAHLYAAIAAAGRVPSGISSALVPEQPPSKRRRSLWRLFDI